MAQHSGYLSALQVHLSDVNEHLNSFILDKHAPVKNIKIKSRSTPFVDGEIKAAMRNRDQLHQHYYHTRDLVDWLNYKNSRNTVKTMLKSYKH